VETDGLERVGARRAEVSRVQRWGRMDAGRTGLPDDGARKKRRAAEEAVTAGCEDVVFVEAHVRFCAIAQLTSVLLSRNAPCSETYYRYFKFKRV